MTLKFIEEILKRIKDNSKLRQKLLEIMLENDKETLPSKTKDKKEN